MYLRLRWDLLTINNIKTNRISFLNSSELIRKHSGECLDFLSPCQYNLIAGGFYDGVMLYSQALNESLSEQRGLGPRPGRLQRPRHDVVTRRMWNRTFPGEDSCLWCSFVFSHACVLETPLSHMGAFSSTNHSTELDEKSLD